MEMKRGLLAMLLVLLFAGQTQAQDWVLDMKTARKTASEENKNILLVFSGSDWCGPCIRLETEIWSSEAFMKYANENLVLLKADFPKKKANRLSAEQQGKNDQLAEKYNEQGAFPFVILMDQNGKILRRASYEKLTPEQYIANLESLK